MTVNIHVKLLNNIMQPHIRRLSRLTNASVTRRRAELWDAERARQEALVGRVEKIQVHYQGAPSDCTLLMNRHLSTPYDCARHLSDAVKEEAVLASVNGQPWDLHRPLETDHCTLSMLYFQDSDPAHVNRAFWRSCSVMLGAVIEEAFKDQHYVQLHSFPSPNVRSGSFVYDVDLPLSDWRPSGDELRVLSAMMRRLAQAAAPLQRLLVPAHVAQLMFADNEHKRTQVPHIAAADGNDGRVTVYRCGDHVDLSRGPLMSHTGLMGRCTITAVHRIRTDTGLQLYRFQGVALPRPLMLSHFSYSLLENRAKELNQGRIPLSSSADTVHSSEMKRSPEPEAIRASTA